MQMIIFNLIIIIIYKYKLIKILIKLQKVNNNNRIFNLLYLL